MNLDTELFKIKYNNISPKAGRVLISEPFSADYTFRRAVVLLTEHDENGSFGFILNKPLNQNLKEISKEFGIFNPKVSFGGPVGENNIFYIHTLGQQIPDSRRIKKGLYWGGNIEAVNILIKSGKINKNNIRFFIGYSGWEKEQLQNEISKNFWLISDLDNKTIMSNKKKIWTKGVSNIGDRYKIWANFPENPFNN